MSWLNFMLLGVVIARTLVSIHHFRKSHESGLFTHPSPIAPIYEKVATAFANEPNVSITLFSLSLFLILIIFQIVQGGQD